MNRPLARSLLFAAVTLFFAAGTSFTQPQGRQGSRSAMPRSPVIRGQWLVAGLVHRTPAPPVAPEPRPAPEPAVAAAPQPAPAPQVAVQPQAAPAPQVSQAEISYVVPVGLAPVTNRNTCRGQSRECCDETMGWCVGEGFYWQHCADCYCGFQCMAPALFVD